MIGERAVNRIGYHLVGWYPTHEAVLASYYSWSILYRKIVGDTFADAIYTGIIYSTLYQVPLRTCGKECKDKMVSCAETMHAVLMHAAVDLFELGAYMRTCKY